MLLRWAYLFPEQGAELFELLGSKCALGKHLSHLRALIKQDEAIRFRPAPECCPAICALALYITRRDTSIGNFRCNCQLIV